MRYATVLYAAVYKCRQPRIVPHSPADALVTKVGGGPVPAGYKKTVLFGMTGYKKCPGRSRLRGIEARDAKLQLEGNHPIDLSGGIIYSDNLIARIQPHSRSNADVVAPAR